MLSPQHLPCAKNARSMHDTVCHAWSNAHEHHILTTSVTAKASREHKDMYKRRIVCSKRKPQDAPCGIHCGKEKIENSMTTPAYRNTKSCRHIEARRARLLLLLTAGRAPLQLLFHREKEAVRTYAGLRKREKRSPVHDRWSAAEVSRLATGQRARDRKVSGGAGMRGAQLTASIDPKLTKSSKPSEVDLELKTPVNPAEMYFPTSVIWRSPPSLPPCPPRPGALLCVAAPVMCACWPKKILGFEATESQFSFQNDGRASAGALAMCVSERVPSWNGPKH